jgi:hypothetical protein
MMSIGFDIVTPGVIKIYIFCNMKPYSPLKVKWGLGGTCASMFCANE